MVYQRYKLCHRASFAFHVRNIATLFTPRLYFAFHSSLSQNIWAVQYAMIKRDERCFSATHALDLIT